MSAIDYIEKTRRRDLRRHPETRWTVSGSGYDQTFVLGDREVGRIDWDRSRYLRVGHDLCFFASCSGSAGYDVVLEKNREGYVPRAEVDWGVGHVGDDVGDE